jgi:ubiquinone/menaquinone biosynthesis C-methylase UbiE
MTNPANQFDQLDNYDDEIPRHVAIYLNEVKTEKNARIIKRFFGGQAGIRGIDLGCGTGEYANSLQQRCAGITVDGMDSSARQIELARSKGFKNTFIHASMTQNDAPAHSYDFAYAINSIHHLPSVEAQATMFQEVRRILRPGGIFIIHEMNTRNPLIGFYLNHVFPRIRNIDDGTEIWLTPARVEASGFHVDTVDHFTFVPDFTPRFAMGVAVTIDQFLSRSRLARFGAHVMYVLRNGQ